MPSACPAAHIGFQSKLENVCGMIILTFCYLQLLSTETSSVLIKKENSRIKRYRKEAGEDCKNGEVSRIYTVSNFILLIACCIDIAFIIMLGKDI